MCPDCRPDSSGEKHAQNGCRAALIRPDHYGVASDSAALTGLTHALINHLHHLDHPQKTRTHDEIPKL